VKAHKTEPESGIIDCRTFAEKVSALSRFVAAGTSGASTGRRLRLELGSTKTSE
jgi:hypothetical protein